MSDIITAVEAGNKSRAEKVQKALEDARVEAAELLAYQHRKAHRTLVKKTLIAVALFLGLYASAVAGLMDWVLATPCMTVVGLWLAVWLGAYIQFMYADPDDGGLLNVSK